MTSGANSAMASTQTFTYTYLGMLCIVCMSVCPSVSHCLSVCLWVCLCLSLVCAGDCSVGSVGLWWLGSDC